MKLSGKFFPFFPVFGPLPLLSACFLLSATLCAEPASRYQGRGTEGESVLRPKTIRGERPAPPPKDSIPLLRPKVQNDVPEEWENEEKPAGPKNPWSISAFATTPLLRENSYEKRFQTFGGLFLLDIPIYQNRGLTVRVHGGGSFSFSRISIPQPAIDFTHSYSDIPLRASLGWKPSPSWELGGFAGVAYRLAEFDSRGSADGGTRATNTDSKLLPDGGLWMDYLISNHFSLGLQLGFLNLSLGTSFRF